MPALIRVLVLLGLIGAVPALWAGTPPIVEHEGSPEALILRFERRALKLEGVEPLVLEIFGDGRVVVDRPAPLRPAGCFETRLSPERLSRLLAEVARPEVVRFDAERLGAAIRERRRAQAAAARRGEGGLRESSGDESLRLSLRLTRWRPEGESGEPGRDVDVELSWRRLGEQAWALPGEPALEGLAGAVAAIDELLASPALRGGP